MTMLSEVIADLQDLFQEHGDRVVIMSQDSEGNGFSPYSNTYSLGRYAPEQPWWGEFQDEDSTDEPWEGDDVVPAVVLWPTN